MSDIKPVSISYLDFKAGKDFTEDVSAAFGANGLGLIVIRDLPDFQKERIAALRTIRKFANLSEETKDKYTHSESNYSFGWSHGKEKMRNGVPDTAKGSYYANPLGDVITDDQYLKDTFPEMYTDNVWPSEDLPELEPAFKNMTHIQVGVGYMICELFDKYLRGLTNGVHSAGHFLDMLKKGTACKGRLLHYFPAPPAANKSEDGLCGWHLDHGGITILTCPLYLDLEGNEIPAPSDCGLHIKHPSDGSIVKVTIPADCLVVQLGESFQYLSGGHLRATAHCVKSSKTPDFTRETLACFMDWLPEETMKLPEYTRPYAEVVHTPFLPEGVPDLEGRMKGVKHYRDFYSNTFRAYHSEN